MAVYFPSNFSSFFVSFQHFFSFVSLGLEGHMVVFAFSKKPPKPISPFFKKKTKKVKP